MKIFNPYEHIDPNFDMSKIKIIYMPTDYAQLPKTTVNFASLQANLPPEEVQARDAEWNKACAKESLQDEQMVSARFVDMKNGDIKAAPAQYKDWKTMAKKGFYKSFGDMYIPNMVNVQMLVETSDHYLVLGDRPPKENGKLPAFQVPGGTLSPNDKRDDHIAPDLGAMREFHEEVGNVPVKNVSYLGASFYAGRVITTLYYTAQLAMTARELSQWREENKEQIKDYQAFPKEHFVPLRDEDIQAVRKTGRLRETAEVGLLLKGKQSLGNAWFAKNCPKRMLNRD